MRISIAFDGSTPIVDTLAAVSAAEEHGLDGVWSAEHVGMNDAVVPSARYLGATERLEVGLVGCNTDTRHAGVLAMELNSLAQLGPDRVRVQVGTGDPVLARSIGVTSRPRPLANVEALVDSLRRLLDGDAVTMSEPGIALDGLRLRRSRGSAPHGVKVDVMGIRPRMLELAARVGDGAALSVGSSRTYLRRVVGDLEKHLVRFDRPREDFRITAVAVGSINRDLDAARRHAAKVLAFSRPETSEILTDGAVDFPDGDAMAAAFREGGPAAAAELLTDETVHALALVATPETLADKLDAYAATGIDELAVMFSGNPGGHVEAVRALAAARPEQSVVPETSIGD